MDEYVVRTVNLTKNYGSFFWKKKTPSLDHLSMDIPQGSVFGFLGPNGAGKTTTIRLMMDLIKPTEGEAFLLGKPAGDIAIRHKIGFLPDAPAFSGYLTAYEFLNICGKLLRIPHGERRGRIDEVLAVVKMTEHAHSKLGGFSRGMTQRIGIAQAIMNNPELLVLDEPLVGLDPHGRQELKEIVLNQKKRGANVFFCSHILSDVEKICDSVGILFKGKLLAFGRLDQLLKKTGSKINIKPGHDDLAQQLLPFASSSAKTESGGWEFVFLGAADGNPKVKSIIESHQSLCSETPFREDLEQFFFNLIEKAKGSADEPV